MKKQLLCLALALVLLLAALPAAALPARAGETEITSLTVYTAPPPPGERSLDLAPLVSLGYGAHCSILACSWLEEPTGYSSVEPDFVFEDGKTYYAYVVLQADEGFVFKKGALIESGVDEGFFAFDGCTLNGADLLFAASRTFATGDFLRLKFAVKSAPETVKHIRSVSFSLTPPKAGDKASDARANVDFPDGQHCTLTDAGWAVKEFENLYRNLSDDDVFEKGMTYILRAEFAADEGSVFNQGGPWGLTAVRVTGGTPLYEYLSVTNSLDDEGRLLSTGSVAVEFTIAEGPETSFFSVLISDAAGQPNAGGGYRLSYPGCEAGDEVKKTSTNNLIENGAHATLTAVPDEGYVFMGWYRGDPDAPAGQPHFSGEPLSTDARYEFDAPLTLTPPCLCAVFEKQHVHSYTAAVTAPTCTEGGYTTYTCACGDSYKGDETPALGHDFGDWAQTKAPACTDKGEEKRSCSRCDAFETRDLPASGHRFGEWVTDAPATVLSEGAAHRTCGVCGEKETKALPRPDPLFGDVDGDGSVTAADARLALRAAVELEDYKPGTYEYLVSDVDFSDEITAADARLILRAAVELEDPAEWLAAYKEKQG